MQTYGTCPGLKKSLGLDGRSDNWKLHDWKLHDWKLHDWKFSSRDMGSAVDLAIKKNNLKRRTDDEKRRLRNEFISAHFKDAKPTWILDKNGVYWASRNGKSYRYDPMDWRYELSDTDLNLVQYRDTF